MAIMNLESFWNDLHYEEIHFRDNLQFELQSDVAPLADARINISTQELYFFIPQALQINQYTFSKEQFYKDRTNLIRFKTPEFTFAELIDANNTQSPLQRIISLKDADLSCKLNSSEPPFSAPESVLQDELKLLANIARSALRTQIRAFVQLLSKPNVQIAPGEHIEAISTFCKDVTKFRNVFWKVLEECLPKWHESVLQGFLYVDEFISHRIDYYMTGFLQFVRSVELEYVHTIDHEVCDLIGAEKKHRQKYFKEPEDFFKEDDKEQEGEREKLLYHKSLLNKYVMDALLLLIERRSWGEKYGNIVAGIAAGIAMLVYVLLLFLNVPYFGINSLPFLLLTVIFYVLKDRIKDTLKSIFHQHAVRLFSDYTTEIHMPNGQKNLGEVKEFFSFVGQKDLSDEVKKIRHERFQNDLSQFKQPETVLYYKKEILLNERFSARRSRRHKLHNIFLFNVHLLLEKASNPEEVMGSLDLNTMEIRELCLPKVYYLNIIMKNSYLVKKDLLHVDFKAFRVVLDKNGIKNVEPVQYVDKEK